MRLGLAADKVELSYGTSYLPVRGSAAVAPAMPTEGPFRVTAWP